MLKAGTTTALLALLEQIQADYQGSKEWQEIQQKAYPSSEVKKKEKKVKDKGSKYPGPAAKTVEAQLDGHVEGINKDKVNLSSGAEAAMENIDIKSGKF